MRCHLLADTRWRSWVAASSLASCAHRADSLPGTCSSVFFFFFFFRAERTSQCFPHQGGACAHTDMHQSGGWDTTRAVWSKNSPDCQSPRCDASRTPRQRLITDQRRTDWPPARPLCPAVSWSRTAAPEKPDQCVALFELLQVRRVCSRALRNARTDWCKTSGKFLSNTYYAKQTCALL